MSIENLIRDKELLKKGYITHEEFDYRSGFERRGRVVDDKERKTYFKNYSKLIEKAMEELDKKENM